MNIAEIRELVEIIKANELMEFELDEGDFSIRIRRGGEPIREIVQASGYPAAALHYAHPEGSVGAPPVSVDGSTDEPGVDLITSPMVGTFYRAPSPESELFATEGQAVTTDTIVCIIEAMKVMNEIQAEKTGTILEVLVEDGDPVEFGQPLFKIKK